jgi:hypothetical protein
MKKREITAASRSGDHFEEAGFFAGAVASGELLAGFVSGEAFVAESLAGESFAGGAASG